jgi:effector-binding domain-containing protein
MSRLRLAAVVVAAALAVTHPAWPQGAASAPATPVPSTPAQPAESNDPFGEEFTLTAKTIIFMKGSGTWDTAFETLIDAFKSVRGFLDRQGIKPAGPAMTIYTSTDDTGFQYQAGVPISEAPKNPPRGDLTVGQSPAGKALKFVHRGSYDAMDETYEKITNYLDDKKLEAQDMFIEEYQTDPLNTPEDKLVVNVFVPLK